MKKYTFKLLALILTVLFILPVMLVISVSADSVAPPVYLTVLPSPLQTDVIKTKMENRDIYLPLVDIITPADSAPVIFEYTKTAGPDETISVVGQGIDHSTHFLVYGQTTQENPVLLQAKIQKMTANSSGAGKALITLPETEDGLPEWSMYMVWAVNSSGASYPMIINKAEAWWVGPDEATSGDTVGLYGRNLTKSNALEGTGNESSIIIVDSDGVEYDAEVVYCNQTKVEFVVPNIAKGVYDVYVHNGHGGNYGYSKCPEPLKIIDKVVWQQDTAHTFNVKDYNAKGDGVTNDTDAVLAAVEAASAVKWSTVYFPEGTYIIGKPADYKTYTANGHTRTAIEKSYGIEMSSYMRLLGDDPEKTKIEGARWYGANKQDVELLWLVGYKDCEYVDFTGITFDSSKMKFQTHWTVPPGSQYYGQTDVYEPINSDDPDGPKREGSHFRKYHHGTVVGANNNHVWFDNCHFYTIPDAGFPFGQPAYGDPWGDDISIDGSFTRGLVDCEYLYINNIYSESQTITIHDSRQVFITNSELLAIDRAVTLIHVWTNDQLAIENVTGRDKNPENTPENMAYSERFICHNNVWGSSYNYYFGNNTADGINPHVNTYDKNAGEIILFESAAGKQITDFEVVDSVTFKNTGGLEIDRDDINRNGPHSMKRSTVTVVSGTGEGQSRKVVDYKYNTQSDMGTVTLDRPWDVLIDETSVLCAAMGVENCAIYGNYLEGEDDYADSNIDERNSCGVILFCQMDNMIIANNEIKKVWRGIFTWPHYTGVKNTGNVLTGFGPISNVLVSENKFSKIRHGVENKPYDWEFYNNSGYTNLYMIACGNIYRNNSFEDMTESGIYIQGAIGTEYNAVYEKNSFKNLPIGILVDTLRMPWQYTNYSASVQTLFYKNTFNRGVRGAKETVPKEFSLGEATAGGVFNASYSTTVSVLRENEFIDFTNNYHSTKAQLPRANMEIPYRAVFLTGAETDTSIAGSIDYYNTGIQGTVELEEAVSNTDWITVTAGGENTISAGDTDNVYSVDIRCSPSSAKLKPGIHEGTVTLYWVSNANYAERKVKVYLHIKPTSGADKQQADREALEFAMIKGDNCKGRDEITQDLNLIPTINGGYGSNITWSTSNADIITNTGVITRGEADQKVTLTATIGTTKKTFEITVKAKEEEKIIAPKRLKGFITNSGNNESIAISDAIAIFRHLADKVLLTDKGDVYAADIDGKNNITIQDAIYIFRYLADKLTMEQLQELHQNGT